MKSTSKGRNHALTAAVIGAGSISEAHLRFLCRRDDTHLLAICDLSRALARFTAERFEAENTFTDYRQMLADLKPQVVHVLTPPHTHVKIVQDCLQSGVHVIVEKPIAPTHAEFVQLVQLAKEKHRLLIEDHNYVFNMPIIKIKQMVKRGLLGDVKEVEVRIAENIRAPSSRYSDMNLPHPSHKLPGGMIAEFLPHLCSVALTFMPTTEPGLADNFSEIQACWNNVGGGELFKYDDLDACLIDRSGVHAHLRFSSYTKPECFTVTVRGTMGTVSTDLYQPHLRLEIQRSIKELTGVLNQWTNGWHLIRASAQNFIDKLCQRGSYDGLTRFLDKTYDSLIKGDCPPVSVEDMYKVSKMIDSLVAKADRV